MILAACGTELPQPPDVSGYPELPADTQRAGDPAKGYDYLVNGGYITCGIPRSAYDRVFGASDPASPAAPAITRRCRTATAPRRRGGRAGGLRELPDLPCGPINGQLVVGLGAADGDFTGDQAQYIDAAGTLITDPTERPSSTASSGASTRSRRTRDADDRRQLRRLPTAALMAHRDPATLAWSTTPLLDAAAGVVAPVDVPPWWRMQKKHAMFYTAAGGAITRAS